MNIKNKNLRQQKKEIFISEILPQLKQEFTVQEFSNGSMFKFFLANEAQLDYYPQKERAALKEKGKQNYEMQWFTIPAINLLKWIKENDYP